MTLGDFNPIIVAILGFAAAFLFLQRVDRYLKIKAVDECAAVARFEKTVVEENARVTYPLEDIYRQCLTR